MNRTKPTLLLQKILHGLKVGFRHKDVNLVCSRIDDTRPIGVASVDRGKLLWYERNGSHIPMILLATQACHVIIPASRRPAAAEASAQASRRLALAVEPNLGFGSDRPRRQGTRGVEARERRTGSQSAPE
jgi:hypothetical protein